MSNVGNETIAKISLKNNFADKIYEAGDVLYNIDFCTITAFTQNRSDFFLTYDRNILWDFGDGTTVLGKTATHFYKNPGRYVVKCTFFNKNGQAVDGDESITVVVSEILGTIFEKLGDKTEEKTVYAGQKCKIGDFLCIAGKDVENNVTIKCRAANTVSPGIDDLDRKDQFLHLLQFHTFIDSNGNYTSEITPDYQELYCHVEIDDDGKNKIKYQILDPSAKIDCEQVKSSTILAGRDIESVLEQRYLADGSYYIGKIAVESISYVDDTPGNSTGGNKEQLSFIYSSNSLKEEPTMLPKDRINMVASSEKITVLPNTDRTDYDDIYLFVSTNGLTSSKDGKLFDTSSGVVLNQTMKDNVYSIEKTAKFIGYKNPFTIRLASVSSENNEIQYFIKDINFSRIRISIFDQDSSIGTYEAFNTYPGSNIIDVIPFKERLNLDEQSAVISVILDNGLSKSCLVNFGEFISFDEMSNPESAVYLDPKQNYRDISAETVLKVYETHPAVQNKENLDTYMLSVLKGENLLETAINKGYNFTDDIANIDTCYIRNLTSICSMLDIDISMYNNENFSRPLNMAEILKLVSIRHSTLVGTKIKTSDEFITIDNMPAKNLGDEYRLSEKIYVYKGEDGLFTWPTIVVYDKFDGRYFTVNSAQIETSNDFPLTAYKTTGEIIENYNKETDIDPSTVEKYSFKLEDYMDSWGWALLLGDYANKLYTVLSPKTESNEITEILTEEPGKRLTKDILGRFYKFFKYIPDYEYKLVDSYLRPETISERVADYTTWYGAPEIELQGSIDKLLYKDIYDSFKFD